MKPYKVYSRACTDWKLCMVSRGAPRQRQNEVLEYELLAQPAAMSQLTQEGNNDTFAGRTV